MKRIFSLVIAVMAASVLLSAQDSPARWIRKNCISPDGSQIAFSWHGDIFTVDAAGGTAFQLTTNSAYDSDPLWSSDGTMIVFSSYREGSKDIWAIPAKGGNPRRLTTWTGAETPLAVLPDGQVLYSSSIQPDAAFSEFPDRKQLYSVSIDGGRTSLVSSIQMSRISVNAAGNILYEDYKGYEDEFRKHHTSSVTRDIWEYNPAQGSFRKLSSFKGENRNPVYAPDGKTYYYLCEDGGNLNIWKASTEDAGLNQKITSLPVHPVRYLSAASNGTLAFSWNGELYTLKDGSEPRKLDIFINTDSQTKERTTLRMSTGAQTMAISPNGKEIAFIDRGEVFVTAVDFSNTRRITDTPGQERNVSFSDDGRTLYYSAERDGGWGIWKTELTNKDDKYFTFSCEMKESRVTKEGETCFQPDVSPDGKWIAYLRDRTELMVKNIKSGQEKSLLKGANYSYVDGDTGFEWSPDSRWILSDYAADGGWNNSDISAIEVESGKVTNLTHSGYSDGSFRWALGGKAMIWQSDKAGYRSHGSWGAEEDIYAMFFDAKAFREFQMDKDETDIEKLLKGEGKKGGKKEEAKDSTKKEPKLVLDLEGREDRIIRLTRFSGRLGDHYLTEDGTKLYYTTRLEKGFDLCCLNIKDGSVKVVQKGVSGRFIPDKDGKNIFIQTGTGLSKMEIASNKITPLKFNAEIDLKPAQEREYIFYHAWKQVKEKFYDPDIHGIDWEGFRDNYAAFLPYINNNFDFQELLSEMLGELNGSHTGARYYYTNHLLAGQQPGRLGVLYDWEWTGKGLKIKEVLPGGALHTADPEIQAGDLILAVNGKEIEEGTNWWDALARTVHKRTLLKVKKGGKTVNIALTPDMQDTELLYRRWVRSKEKLVKELSGGRIGYVHVRGMNSDSFREVYSNLLGKYRNCDAVVVDIRHNGGGWLHDDLVTLLGGKAYLKFQPRGQYIGTEPYSKWTKPSCVLMCENDYSDASGFPYAYRSLGIGKLIGEPVPGTMTAVWWERQIDPTIVFGIPQVGSWGIKEGRYLENFQLEPDIVAHNRPEDLLQGKDPQLETAVREMLQEVSK
ncbi:MAG: PD40 domain-containing protein [Bacteroidales bacterium]|nr:PD40 domain-containing protein [Bacteroidales bacterium]